MFVDTLLHSFIQVSEFPLKDIIGFIAQGLNEKTDTTLMSVNMTLELANG